MRPGSHVANQRRIALRHSKKLRRWSQTRRFHRTGNVEHGETLRHNDRINEHVAESQALMNVLSAGRFVEEVFAGFERRPAMKVVPQKKRLLAANDAGSPLCTGNSPRR